MNKEISVIECEVIVNGDKSVKYMSFYNLETFKKWKEINKKTLKSICDLREVFYLGEKRTGSKQIKN
jgi:hypothetical protein